MANSESIKLKLKSQEIADITGKVQEIVRRSEVEEGICNVFSVGSTGSVIINENEPMLVEDLKKVIEKLSGSKELYQHMENAHSHIRSVFLGSSQTIPVRKGELVLGTWQSIILINFDSRSREREVMVSVVGD